MPEQAVHAIVLRRKDQGESDRRVTLLTEELGKIDAVAKGARKVPSRLSSVTEPLSLAVLNLAEGKRNRFVTQAQPLRSFPGLRTDFERLSCGLALVELYAAVLPFEEPMPEAFERLTASLRAVETHEKPIVALLWSEVQLLAISGFMPHFHQCVVTEQPVAEAEPYVSPSAGGYVTDGAAGPYFDKFRTRVEVLYALARLPDLEAAPANIRQAERALADLLPFWRAIAEAPLPANEAAVREARHRASTALA